MRAALASCALLLLPGCFDAVPQCFGVICSACPPSILLFVRDPGGQGVANVTVTGVDASCAPDPGLAASPTICQARVAAGSYSLTVSAPGFADAAVTVEVASAPAPGGAACCGICSGAPARNVELAPAP